MHQINKTEKKCARRPKHVLRRLGKTVWNMTDSVDTVAKPITVSISESKRKYCVFGNWKPVDSRTWMSGIWEVGKS